MHNSIKKSPKEWKSFKEQLALLKERGILVNDEERALNFLKTVGYYRLSGYLYPFRKLDPQNNKQRLNTFIEGTTFENVKQLYLFDKKLRQLAIPIAYKKMEFFDARFVNNMDYGYVPFMMKHDDLIKRSAKENAFIKHYLENYSDIPIWVVPIWVVCEIWDFGTMSKLFRGMQDKDRAKIAQFYRLKSGKQLENYLHSLNIIRNISAHYGRLWNRAITKKSNVSNLQEDLFSLDNAKPFAYFCIMKKLLDRICPNSTWGERFIVLINEFPEVKNGAISLEDMGITGEFKQSKLWKQIKNGP